MRSASGYPPQKKAFAPFALQQAEAAVRSLKFKKFVCVSIYPFSHCLILSATEAVNRSVSVIEIPSFEIFDESGKKLFTNRLIYVKIDLEILGKAVGDRWEIFGMICVQIA